MLDLDRVDLGELCSALEDNSREHEWWLDPSTGELEIRSEYFESDDGDDHPADRGWVYVEPVGSGEAYGDMEDFVARVPDSRAGDLLERALAEREEGSSPELPGPLDPHAIAAAVAGDLRKLYGERLKQVVLFGSWARGDAHPESDIDLLVVLDRVDSLWDELRRMDPVLWRHSFDNDTVVTATPVAKGGLEERKA